MYENSVFQKGVIIKMAVSNGYIKLDFERVSADEQFSRVEHYVQTMEKRKIVRSFSDRPVSEKLVEKAIETAGRAPSGANQQPWTYVLIKDPVIKKEIRKAAELEDENSGNKQYLEDAPYLVALFRINYGLAKQADGSLKKVRHYYVPESTPLSGGFFLAALQHAGLDCLVHAPVAASQQILHRPKNEKPLLLFAVGYAKEQALGCTGKPLSDIVISNASFSNDVSSAPNESETLIVNDETQLAAIESYFQFMKKRRNVRQYARENVDINLLYQAMRAVAIDPFGGEQPYRFAIVSNDEQKQKIRELAEIEEVKLYQERISDEWREALAPLGTNESKPHLTDAAHLVVAFYDTNERKNFALERASMAVGMLMGALHHAGLCTLTYTPSPMAFLRDYLERPKNEMPFIVLPVGYPAADCEVPDIIKKPLSEVLVKF